MDNNPDVSGERRGARRVLAAFFIVIANLAVDILYAVVDPRVRF